MVLVTLQCPTIIRLVFFFPTNTKLQTPESKLSPQSTVHIAPACPPITNQQSNGWHSFNRPHASACEHQCTVQPCLEPLRDALYLSLSLSSFCFCESSTAYTVLPLYLLSLSTLRWNLGFLCCFWFSHFFDRRDHVLVAVGTHIGLWSPIFISGRKSPAFDGGVQRRLGFLRAPEDGELVEA